MHPTPAGSRSRDQYVTPSTSSAEAIPVASAQRSTRSSASSKRSVCSATAPCNARADTTSSRSGRQGDHAGSSTTTTVPGSAGGTSSSIGTNRMVVGAPTGLIGRPAVRRSAPPSTARHRQVPRPTTREDAVGHQIPRPRIGRADARRRPPRQALRPARRPGDHAVDPRREVTKRSRRLRPERRGDDLTSRRRHLQRWIARMWRMHQREQRIGRAQELTVLGVPEPRLCDQLRAIGEWQIGIACPMARNSHGSPANTPAANARRNAASASSNRLRGFRGRAYTSNRRGAPFGRGRGANTARSTAGMNVRRSAGSAGRPNRSGRDSR